VDQDLDVAWRAIERWRRWRCEVFDDPLLRRRDDGRSRDAVNNVQHERWTVVIVEA